MLYRTRCDEWVGLYESGLSVKAIGAQYGVSGEAVWAALKRRNVKTRTISEAATGKRRPNMAHRRKHFVENERAFKVVDTEDKAYWLGFLMADGSVGTKVGRSRRYTLSLCLAEEDGNHVELFRRFLGADYPIEVAPPGARNKQNQVRLQVISEDMCLDLMACGCVPRKTWSMAFPFDAVPWQLLRHFVRGFFDGDGTVTKLHKDRQNAKVSFACASEEFVIGLKAFLLESGFDHAVPWKSAKLVAWELSINRQKEVRAMYDWFYSGATVYLPRKKAKFEELLGITTPSTKGSAS